ncbi:hypothetical protein EYF80_018601 [Liparis tanakae]|uniref:Uncharacterized protein n=1 Tax=Liparis tanakae TaxID=230148 RepID=A0A4Z2I1Y1_9TELE|nr:hypothetical protein EYF80_018601 [Liparis tanakae]
MAILSIWDGSASRWTLVIWDGSVCVVRMVVPVSSVSGNMAARTRWALCLEVAKSPPSSSLTVVAPDWMPESMPYIVCCHCSTFAMPLSAGSPTARQREESLGASQRKAFMNKPTLFLLLRHQLSEFQPESVWHEIRQDRCPEDRLCMQRHAGLTHGQKLCRQITA